MCGWWGPLRLGNWIWHCISLRWSRNIRNIIAQLRHEEIHRLMCSDWNRHSWWLRSCCDHVWLHLLSCSDTRHWTLENSRIHDAPQAPPLFSYSRRRLSVAVLKYRWQKCGASHFPLFNYVKKCLIAHEGFQSCFWLKPVFVSYWNSKLLMLNPFTSKCVHCQFIIHLISLVASQNKTALDLLNSLEFPLVDS